MCDRLRRLCGAVVNWSDWLPHQQPITVRVCFDKHNTFVIYYFSSFFYSCTISSVKAKIFFSQSRQFLFTFTVRKYLVTLLTLLKVSLKLKFLKVTQLVIRETVWKAIIQKILRLVRYRFVNYAPVFSLSKLF